MEIEVLSGNYVICQFARESLTAQHVSDLFKLCRLDEFGSLTCNEFEWSWVCPERALASLENVSANSKAVEGPWRVFRIKGTLDFDLIGVLAKISKILADRKISVFVISTFQTDYFLVKSANLEQAVTALAETGIKVSD